MFSKLLALTILTGSAAFAQSGVLEPVPNSVVNPFGNLANSVGVVTVNCTDGTEHSGSGSGFIIHSPSGPLLVSNAHVFYDEDGAKHGCQVSEVRWYPEANVWDESSFDYFRFDYDPINFDLISRDYIPRISINDRRADIAIFEPLDNGSELERFEINLAENWELDSLGAFSIANDYGYLDGMVEYVQVGCETEAYWTNSEPAWFRPKLHEEYKEVFVTDCIGDKGQSGGPFLAFDKVGVPYAIGINVAGVDEGPSIKIPIQNLIFQLEVIFGEGAVPGESPEFFTLSDIARTHLNCREGSISTSCRELAYEISLISRVHEGTNKYAFAALTRAASFGDPRALLEMGLLFEAPNNPTLGVPIRDFKYPVPRTDWSLELKSPPLSQPEVIYSILGERFNLRSHFDMMLPLFEESGGSHDPVQAANHYIEALRRGNCDLLERQSSDWNDAVARELQSNLQNLDLYTGRIDGDIGPGTKLAMSNLARC